MRSAFSARPAMLTPRSFRAAFSSDTLKEETSESGPRPSSGGVWDNASAAACPAEAGGPSSSLITRHTPSSHTTFFGFAGSSPPCGEGLAPDRLVPSQPPAVHVSRILATMSPFSASPVMETPRSRRICLSSLMAIACSSSREAVIGEGGGGACLGGDSDTALSTAAAKPGSIGWPLNFIRPSEPTTKAWGMPLTPAGAASLRWQSPPASEATT
mmetsp:Transcript_34882/g.98913  ORF Transcript_34882/g.98913 Transcript_34882/m.98913 type:complete len:214 (+) Transcript_34882:319-960(+)